MPVTTLNTRDDHETQHPCSHGADILEAGSKELVNLIEQAIPTVLGVPERRGGREELVQMLAREPSLRS